MYKKIFIYYQITLRVKHIANIAESQRRPHLCVCHTGSMPGGRQCDYAMLAAYFPVLLIFCLYGT